MNEKLRDEPLAVRVKKCRVPVSADVRRKGSHRLIRNKERMLCASGDMRQLLS